MLGVHYSQVKYRETQREISWKFTSTLSEVQVVAKGKNS